MKCIKRVEIKPMKSPAGYYLGGEVYDEEMGCKVPNCRVSVEYYKTEAEAQEAINNGFELRDCLENKMCSGGRRCCPFPKSQSIGGIMVKKMIEECEKGR